jgi:hypothetical protein
MKPGYDMFAWMIDGILPEKGVPLVHDVMSRQGAVLDPDSVFVLNRCGDQLSIADFVDTAEATLAQLAAWPTLGSVEYLLDEVSIAISFHPIDEMRDRRVGCIQLSVSSDWFDRHRPMSEETFSAIGSALHSAVAATRTVMNWNSAPPDISWMDEFKNLQSGIMKGEYDLDLRSDSGRESTWTCS